MAAGSIVIDMLMNTGSFEAGTEKVSYQLQRAISQFEKLTGTMVQVGKINDDAGNSVKALALGYDSLTNSAKLVEASNKAMTAEILRANAAMKAGAVSAQNAAMLSASRAAELNAEAQRKLSAELARAAAQQAHLAKQADMYAARQGGVATATNRVTGATQASQAGFRNMNQIIQNSSYQITDFVVQVQGGVSAMRAFSQQAPQFLGGFGKWGAVAGVVAALGASFVPMIVEAIKGASAIKSFEDATKQAQDGIGSFSADAIINSMKGVSAETRKAIASLYDLDIELMKRSAQKERAGISRPSYDITLGDEGLIQATAEKWKLSADQAKAYLSLLDTGIGSEKFINGLNSSIEKHNALKESLRGLFDQEIKLQKATEARAMVQKAAAEGVPDKVSGRAAKAPKTVKEEKSEMDLFVESINKAEASFMLLDEKRHVLDSLKESLAPEVYQKFSDELDRAAGGLQKINENALRIGPTMEQAFGQAIQQGVSGLVDVFFDANQSFSEFAENFLTQISKMIMQMMLLKAIEGGLNAWGFGGGGGGGGGPVGPVINPNAKGNAFNHGIQKFANGGAFTNSIVSRPTMFAYGGAFGGQTGVMGEAGPEAIMPLKRDSSGRLGVSGGSSNVSVVINNNSGQPASQNETVDSRGNRKIEVMIGEMVSAEVRRSGSSVNQSIRQTFNARPALVGR